MQKKLLLSTIAVGIFIFAFIYYVHIPTVRAGGSDTTIGFISDARTRLTLDGQTALTTDINQFSSQMGVGWSMTAFQTVGDLDYISESTTPNTQTAFLDSNLSSLPVFYTVGNHEAENQFDIPALDLKYSTYPNWNLKPGPTNGTNTTYSYDSGDLHVAVLNEYFDGFSEKGSNGDVNDVLFDWLKNDLRNSSKKYKIVVGHEPAYPEVRHIGDSLDENPAHRNRFWNLLQTERVTTYIVGHTHTPKLKEYNGVFEMDSGIAGAQAGNQATISYVHTDTNGIVLRQANENPDGGWSNSTIVSKTPSDLNKQILVNTFERSGTPNRYWVDYDSTVASNPDWTSYGKFWENSFNDVGASWQDGEMGVGYETNNPQSWGWLNTKINPDPNSTGQSHVNSIFQRVKFTVENKENYQKLILGTDFDDAETIWLNGVKIYESALAPNYNSQDQSTFFDQNASSSSHAATGEHTLSPFYSDLDISNNISLLTNGDNYLTIANWNASAGSSDLNSAVKLYLSKNDQTRPSAFVESSNLGGIVLNFTEPLFNSDGLQVADGFNVLPRFASSPDLVLSSASYSYGKISFSFSSAIAGSTISFRPETSNLFYDQYGNSASLINVVFNGNVWEVDPGLVSVDSNKISELINSNAFSFVSVGTLPEQTSKVTVNKNISLRVGDTNNPTLISLPYNTEITEINDQPFLTNQLQAQIISNDSVSNIGELLKPESVVQWGIPGVTLKFSSPITIRLFVGNSLNGQTLSIVRSPTGSSGWTSTGIESPSSCIVAAGFCQFSATQASYYAATSVVVPVVTPTPTPTPTLAPTNAPTPIPTSAPVNNPPSSNNNTPSAPTCVDSSPLQTPDLFQISASKGKAKLFYTPVSDKVTGYAVIYGYKKNDERFATLMSTINNNQGIQSFEVGKLDPKKTYYFKVAAINGCTSSPWSEWMPVQANKKKTVYKYKKILINKKINLLNLFK